MLKNTDISDPGKQKIKEHGYYIHYAPPEGNQDFVDYHTHGLEQSRNHKDFQVLLPAGADILYSQTTYSPMVAMPADFTTICKIISGLVDLVDKGAVFQSGMELYEPIYNYSVKIVDSTENGRAVLRILLPDENGNYR